MTNSQSEAAMAERQQWLDAATMAARGAAAFIAERAHTRSEIEWQEKAATDFVSLVDIGAEERIRASLEASLPGIRVIGEELGPATRPGDGLVAIVDPLDGTSNFLHGYPAYAVSIGIVLDGAPQAGVVHDVARGGVYTATLGGGAFVDGLPLHVSATERTTRALVGTGFPFRTMNMTRQYLNQLEALIPQVSGMRRSGSAALDLCDLARGRFDAFWELDLAAWDVAAGILIIREAGGVVTDLDGVDAAPAKGPIVASNGVLHEWFLKTLSDALNVESGQVPV